MEVNAAHKLRHLMTAILAAFGVLAVWLAYWQVVMSGPLLEHPANRRRALLEERIKRGAIYDRAGRLLASTVYHQQEPARKYYYHPVELAPVLGYHSERYEESGIEQGLDAELSGRSEAGIWQELRSLVSGSRRQGSDVYLTIDAQLQAVAYDALGDYTGAVAIVQPATGQILALASKPSYDPSRIDEDLDELGRAEPSRLLDRATQGLYPPGSSFKVVTAVAALEAGVVKPSSGFHCSGSTVIGRNYRVECFEGGAHGDLSFAQALEQSCNCTFARVATRVGAERLWETASRFGFGHRLELPVPTRTSRIARKQSDLSLGVLAQTGFGQGECVVTPLQMALVAAAIGNGGKLMKPYLVTQIREQGRIVQRIKPEEWAQVAKRETVAEVARMMQGVVRHGTGTRARVRGLTVAGKTGTAENPHGRTHAWFIGYAPADHPRVALAVLLENGGVGGRHAAPVARQILEWLRDRWQGEQ